MIDTEDLLSRFLGTLGGEEYVVSGQIFNAFLTSGQTLMPYPALLETLRSKTPCNTITISGSTVGTASDPIQTKAESPDVIIYVCDPSPTHIGLAGAKYIFSAPKDYEILSVDVASTVALIRDNPSFSPSEFRIRGYFSPVYKRKWLFTQEINISKGKLPRLKPNIILDKRSLDREK